MKLVSNCSEQDTSVLGITPLSNFDRSKKDKEEKHLWGWVEDDLGNIVDITCPFCKRSIYHTASGRMICPECGRTAGDHGKRPIDPDKVIDRSFIPDSKFFRQAKDGQDRRIQRGSEIGKQETSDQSRSTPSSQRRHEPRCTTRY
jgi:hypothetical protein